MATTLLDIAARQGADQFQITYDLVKQNPLLMIAPAFGAQGGVFRSSILTTKPTVSARAANQGTVATKPTYVPTTFKTSTYTPTTKVDEMVANQSTDGLAAVLTRENEPHMMSLADQVENDAINNAGGDGINMTGLANIKNAVDGETVISAGGSSARSSMYFINFGAQGFRWMYNSNVGGAPSMNYMGLVETDDSDGNPYWAHTTKFNWEIGSVVNAGGVGRYANINASNKPTLENINKILRFGKFGYNAILCNRDIAGYLDNLNTNPLQYHVTGDGAKRIDIQLASISGVPIIVSDAITNNEANVA